MSLAFRRVTALCRRSTCVSAPAIRTRPASSDSHSHHEEDTTTYPEESFNTPFWRSTAIVTLLGFGIYNILPFLDKDGTYITRYIQLYMTPSHTWTRAADKHLEQSVEAAQGALVIASAMRPPVLRMRYPASLDYASPHCIAVGSQTDVSNVVVKKADPWA